MDREGECEKLQKMSSSWAERWWRDISRSSHDGCGLVGDDDKEGNDAGGNMGTTVQTMRTKKTDK